MTAVTGDDAAGAVIVRFDVIATTVFVASSVTAAIVFVIASFAEAARLPFDLDIGIDPVPSQPLGQVLGNGRLASPSVTNQGERSVGHKA